MGYILMGLQAVPPFFTAFFSSPLSKHLLDKKKRKKAFGVVGKAHKKVAPKLELLNAKLRKKGKFATPKGGAPGGAPPKKKAGVSMQTAKVLPITTLESVKPAPHTMDPVEPMGSSPVESPRKSPRVEPAPHATNLVEPMPAPNATDPVEPMPAPHATDPVETVPAPHATDPVEPMPMQEL